GSRIFSSTRAVRPTPPETSQQPPTSTNTGSGQKCLASGAYEHRLALFHESLAAFLIIAALEAGVHRVLRTLQVALAFVLHHLADHRLDRLDGQWRVASDHIGVVL